MNLQEWREKQNMSRVSLAKILDITEGQNPSQKLRNYEIGVSAVPIILAPKIIKITNGEVTLGDLVKPRIQYLKTRDLEAAQ